MSDQLVETEVTLGNASELALAIIRGVLGNEIATTITGNELTNSICLSMIQARMQHNLSLHLGENK